MDVQTILVPVDFSECSLHVVHQAAGLGAKLGARLVILHVGELPPGLPPDACIHAADGDHEAARWVTEDARRRLASFVEVARAGGADARPHVALGAVAPTILAVTERFGADLLVMGTHGRSGLARLVLGSVAETVAHQASAPVLLIRREPRPECAGRDCAWCTHDDRSPAERQAAAETLG